MNLNQMFAAVSRQTSLSAERFLTFYNESVKELCAQYGDKYVLSSSNNDDRVTTVYDEPLAISVFDQAIINNILWLNDSSQTTYKEMSLSERDYAFNTHWRGKNKRPRVHSRSWM